MHYPPTRNLATLVALGYSRERVQPLPFEALNDALVLLSYYVAIIL